MKRVLLGVLCAVACAALVVLPSCSQTMRHESSLPESREESAGYTSITAQEAKRMMDEGSVTLVDVRTPYEYEEAHIPGAVSFPIDEFDETQLASMFPDKDATMLVYCRTGVRSKIAAEKLVEYGYANVYDAGGIRDWPYETVRPTA